jgi:predicted Holliday junction resolvase-like endonuclease
MKNGIGEPSIVVALYSIFPHFPRVSYHGSNNFIIGSAIGLVIVNLIKLGRLEVIIFVK